MTDTNTKSGRQRRGKAPRGRRFGKAKRPGGEMSVGVIEKVGVRARSERAPDPVAHLVERCQEGDPDAFCELFERHVGGVQRHLTLLIGPGNEVDDLVQLVFLNVFQSIGRFCGKSAFSTWLFRITINVARQEIRSRTRQRRLTGAVSDVAEMRGTAVHETPENRLATWQRVYEVLDRLTFKKRETFILYMYEGYSLEEIARLLGSSVSTIGSRLQAARREIVRMLEARER